jgi:amidase
MRIAHIALSAGLLAMAGSAVAAPPAKGPRPATRSTAGARYEVAEKSISELQADMQAHRATSESLVLAYQARIQTVDRGPGGVHSVIVLNPHAVQDARALDAERRAGHVRGPLHGVPVLIKDNIETADDMPTTAGSLALKANLTHRDAPIVARLRAAGAVILGKTNLSEWANIRSNRSISGWSAVGGQTRNPYALDRNPCGSSAGSGAAAAASLAAATVGTETDGSIVCPSATNGDVGLKPTVGLLSRTHIVPISHTQDTPGPIVRNVTDAAIMLNAMAGSDAADPATVLADARRTDYLKALDPGALKGKRVGVFRFCEGFQPETDALFEKALAELKAGGAELVDIKEVKTLGEVGQAEGLVLTHELKADMAAYLATTPQAVKSRTLADLIAFDKANASAEMPLFGQEFFEDAEKTTGLDAPEYKKALETAHRLAGPEGIDRLLADNHLDALVAPTGGPAFFTDPLRAGGYRGCGTARLPAVAGYPHLTVPMGYIDGLPVGLSFIGEAWSEAKLLGLGYAYEQRTHLRHAPTYVPSVLDMPEIAKALKPQG